MLDKYGLKAKIEMAEFFLELFTEEMPPNLQSAARENLLINFKSFFDKENIIYDAGDDINVFSTPNRLVICFKNINKEIFQKAEEKNLKVFYL